MPTEEEKRLHRCCFSGHRPEKLEEDGDKKTELSPKLYAAAEIKRQLHNTKKLYPLMNEEEEQGKRNSQKG